MVKGEREEEAVAEEDAVRDAERAHEDGQGPPEAGRADRDVLADAGGEAEPAGDVGAGDDDREGGDQLNQDRRVAVHRGPS